MRGVLARPKRTGELTVKLSHPAGAFALFALVFAASAAALIRYGSALDSVKGNEALKVILAITAVLLPLYLLRRAIRALIAARAGGVEITMLPARSGKKNNDIEAERIAARLREALTDVYLSSPSVVPGESARQDFLTEVRAAVENAKSPWAAFVAALSVLRPRNVYRVYCTVQEDSSPGHQTMTLEVSAYPSWDVSVTTVSGSTWPEVTRKASCVVAAYVLPRTDLSRRPPWLPWHGIKLGHELFFSLHEARRLARRGRLEESLHYFDESIGQDPLNTYIRIEKATVLDQLGLWIDALATYVDAVTIESWYDRSVWQRYRRIVGDLVEGTPRPFSRSPNGRGALQLARYRMICSLAASDRLARQWCRHTAGKKRQPGEPPLARQREAAWAILRLRPLLKPYAKRMLDGYCPLDCSPESSALHKRQREEILARLDSDDPAVLLRLFRFAALEECTAMERDYRWSRIRRWARLPVSQPAIRVLPVWSAIQYRYLECIQAHDRWCAAGASIPLWFSRRAGGSASDAMAWLKRIDAALWGKSGGDGSSSPLVDRRWPPLPDGVAQLLQDAAGKGFWGSRGWHNHYNAACTFAVSMLTPQILEADMQSRKKVSGYDGKCCRDGKDWCDHEKELKEVFDRHRVLVWHAVNELSCAVSASDSQFAAGQSVWLRRGDQDLDDLRVTENYAIFMERYLPEAFPVPALPEDPTLPTVSGHMINLIGRYAGLRGSFWHAHIHGDPASPGDFLDEPTWWMRLREFCADYGDWRTRQQLIAQAVGFSGGNEQFNPSMNWPRTGLPRNKARDGIGAWDDVTKEGGHKRADEWLGAAKARQCYARDVIQERNRRLELLGIYLKDPERIDEVLREPLKAAAHKPVSRCAARELASTWEAVGQWFSDDDFRALEGAARKKISRLRKKATQGFR